MRYSWRLEIVAQVGTHREVLLLTGHLEEKKDGKRCLQSLT